MKQIVTIGFVLVAWAAAGCNKSACTEGASVSCACPSGGTGAQVCTNGAYGACSCTAATPTPAPTPAATPTPAPAAASPTPAPAQPTTVYVPVPEKSNDKDKDHDKEVREAKERLDKATHDLADLDNQIKQATAALQAAANDHDRQEAKHKLEDLQRQELEAKGRVDEAKKALDQVDHHDDDHKDHH
jgi:hypothetical protein